MHGVHIFEPLNLDWEIKDWENLKKDDFHDCLKLRINVFVVEQDCPYPELDGLDKKAWHLYARGDDAIAAYLRILPKGIVYDEVAIGRVVIDYPFRGLGIGYVIMREAMDWIVKNLGAQPIRLGAQSHLQGYYKNLGFKSEGEIYLEDGIPHIEMVYQPSEQ